MEFTGHTLMRILQRRDFYRALPPLGEKKKPLNFKERGLKKWGTKLL
jgi:hypothetical protein